MASCERAYNQLQPFYLKREHFLWFEKKTLNHSMFTTFKVVLSFLKIYSVIFTYSNLIFNTGFHYSNCQPANFFSTCQGDHFTGPLKHLMKYWKFNGILNNCILSIESSALVHCATYLKNPAKKAMKKEMKFQKEIYIVNIYFTIAGSSI